jgi:hypothetical protein
VTSLHEVLLHKIIYEGNYIFKEITEGMPWDRCRIYPRAFRYVVGKQKERNDSTRRMELGKTVKFVLGSILIL